MTEQEIKDLQVELEILANTIQSDSNDLFTEQLSLQAFEEDLENIRAENMRTILQQKALFPNEEWRKIGSRDIESGNIAARNLKTDIITQDGIVSGLKSLIERNRKVYRSKELLMLWGANGVP